MIRDAWDELTPLQRVAVVVGAMALLLLAWTFVVFLSTI